MMFADAKDIETHLIGKFYFFHQIAQTLRRVDGAAGARLQCRFSEGIDTELHCVSELCWGGFAAPLGSAVDLAALLHSRADK